MRARQNEQQRQPSFAEVGGDPIWERPTPPSRGWEKWRLPASVLNELRGFEATLLRQGQVRATSTRTYRKELACVAKQAQRFLGRPLTGLAEIYQVTVIAAVAKDDVPFDEITPQLAASTLRLRRTVLRAYLRAVGLPGMSFQEAEAVLDEGLRRAARRRGYRYIIASGRRPGHHYRPRREDVDQVTAVARSASTTFVGARDAAVIALARHTGLRCGSILAMDGGDFSERHGQLFLLVKEKGRPGRREIEVPSEVIPFLTRYESVYNGYALERGWSARVSIGTPGPFWRGCRGRPWTYGGLLAMVRTCTRATGVRPFTMHALRHLRASVLGSHIPSEEAAAAGGWRNVGVYERHYARTLWTWQPELPGPEPPKEPELPGPEPAKERETSEEAHSAQPAS